MLTLDGGIGAGEVFALKFLGVLPDAYGANPSHSRFAGLIVAFWAKMCHICSVAQTHKV